MEGDGSVVPSSTATSSRLQLMSTVDGRATSTPPRMKPPESITITSASPSPPPATVPPLGIMVGKSSNPNTRSDIRQRSNSPTDRLVFPLASTTTTTPAGVSSSVVPIPIGGRPRSISISSGSPSPAKDAPLPSLFSPPSASPASSIARFYREGKEGLKGSSWASSSNPLNKTNNGQRRTSEPLSSSLEANAVASGSMIGHRSTLSVPDVAPIRRSCTSGFDIQDTVPPVESTEYASDASAPIVSPLPIPATDVRAGGRRLRAGGPHHRRTHSVSPPGFSLADLAVGLDHGNSPSTEAEADSTEAPERELDHMEDKLRVAPGKSLDEEKGNKESVANMIGSSSVSKRRRDSQSPRPISTRSSGLDSFITGRSQSPSPRKPGITSPQPISIAAPNVAYQKTNPHFRSRSISGGSPGSSPSTSPGSIGHNNYSSSPTSPLAHTSFTMSGSSVNISPTHLFSASQGSSIHGLGLSPTTASTSMQSNRGHSHTHSGGSHHSHHHHHPTASHAALLSGVRSHALPSSPVLEAHNSPLSSSAMHTSVTGSTPIDPINVSTGAVASGSYSPPSFLNSIEFSKKGTFAKRRLSGGSTGTPQSPPFGPTLISTSPLSQASSPLAQRASSPSSSSMFASGTDPLHRARRSLSPCSDSMAFNDDMHEGDLSTSGMGRGRRNSGDMMDTFVFGDHQAVNTLNHPGARNVPPLFPIPSNNSAECASSMATGRTRSSSLSGNSERPSAASMYLEEQDPLIEGQPSCTEDPHHQSSPPGALVPTLNFGGVGAPIGGDPGRRSPNDQGFSVSDGTNVSISPPLSPPLLSVAMPPVGGRPRARSFGTPSTSLEHGTIGSAPLSPSDHESALRTGAAQSPSHLSIPQRRSPNLSPSPPSPTIPYHATGLQIGNSLFRGVSPPRPVSAVNMSPDPELYSQSGDEELSKQISVVGKEDLLPPPSPHGGTISLPPPLVAPAPLPPHLGGPPLHQHHPLGSRLRGSRNSSPARTGHTPKKHSPLASPALGSDASDSDDEPSNGYPSDQRVVDQSDSEQFISTDGTDAVAVAEALSRSKGTSTSNIKAHAAGEMDIVEGISAEAMPLLQKPFSLGQDFSSARIDHDHHESSPYMSIPAENSANLYGHTDHNKPVDEGFLSSSPPTAQNARVPFGDADIGSGLIQSDHPVFSVSPPVHYTPSAFSIDTKENIIGQHQHHAFGGLGYMDVDGVEFPSSAASALGLDTSHLETSPGDQSVQMIDHAVPRHEDDEMLAIDESTLSALERIFLCAKSDAPEERARVAHHLADWLQNVDICEAVEYVLPLFAGLATDSEDVVKEMFVPHLDRIMWHFFSQCPLAEMDATRMEHQSGGSSRGSPVPSRYMELPSHQQHHHVDGSSSNLMGMVSGDSIAGSSTEPPSTNETSPSNSEIAEIPRISATVFTSLLGALLTDQSTNVAKLTESALVRFLCRLNGKPLPPDPYGELLPHEVDFPLSDKDLKPTGNGDFSLHSHPPYTLSAEATHLLEDEFVTGIVLGLARLDEDGRADDENCSMDSDAEVSSLRRAGDDETIVERSQGNSQEAVVRNAPVASTFVLSPEEEQVDDAWLAASSEPDNVDINSETNTWGGGPLISYFDDGLDQENCSSETQGEEFGSSPFAHEHEHVYSSFSPDVGHGDEESSIGKMVSMSLIGAIASAECLEVDLLVHQILPEVDRMKIEPMFFVRKEAMQALGSLARFLPVEILESSVLPLHSTFARDELWHVRRAACLALPSICKRLVPDLRRQQVVGHVRAFATDPNQSVRSGALEVCGELIYLFHEEPTGVPDEVIEFFLGRELSAPPNSSGSVTVAERKDEVFTPLQSALDSPPPTSTFSGFGGGDGDGESLPSWGKSPAVSGRDPDRPVMCAFNIPAVALTLGATKWHILRGFHHELCLDKVAKVRQSLASSLFEIAKIIGHEQASDSLIEPFSLFLNDYDHIQGAVLENVDLFIASLTLEGSRRVLNCLSDSWVELKVWRRREGVAKKLLGIGTLLLASVPRKDFGQEEGEAGVVEEVLGVFNRAFKDQVAAVRDEAVNSISDLFHVVSKSPSSKTKLSAFLSVFASDSGYRNRVTFVSCALASVRAGIERDVFEAYFLDALNRLVRDVVVNVRIGVARVLKEACESPSLYADPSTRSNPSTQSGVVETIPSARNSVTIQDLIQILGSRVAVEAASSSITSDAPRVVDREVAALLDGLYIPLTPSSRPVEAEPSSLSPERLALGNHVDGATAYSDSESYVLPMAGRRFPNVHGIGEGKRQMGDEKGRRILMDEDDEEEEEMQEISLGPNPAREHHQHTTTPSVEDTEEEDSVMVDSVPGEDSEEVMDDGIDNMQDDKVSLTPITRELEGEDFVEVAKR